MTASMQSLVQEYLDERRRLGFSLSIAGGQLIPASGAADSLRGIPKAGDP